jgi:hypothetical protein
MRFIELIWERHAQDAFRGKYAATLTTSIHFFDHTAHDYLRAICDDLQMKHVGGHSPSMYDVVSRNGRRLTEQFADRFLTAIAEQAPSSPAHFPMPTAAFRYEPGEPARRTPTGGKRVLIVHDAADPTSNVAQMAARLRGAFDGAVTTINLHEVSIKGGCLGCLRCAYDNECVYFGQDGHRELHREHVAPADIVVFAGELGRRFLSARFKQFLDRSFFHNHVPWLRGKQLAFLVGGPLSQNPLVRQIVRSMAEMQQANLVDIIGDEAADSAALDAQLDALAGRLIRDAQDQYIAAPTYLGVGGKKLFRDAVYGDLRFVFQADHRYYKAHGLYDFPQKKWRQRLFNATMMLMTALPGFRRRFYQREIKRGMLQPFRRALNLPSGQWGSAGEVS